MANPLQILLGGGSQAHQQREAEISSAAAQKNVPPAPSPQQTPVQPGNNPATGQPSFLSSAATTLPLSAQLAGGGGSALAGGPTQRPGMKSLLGQ